MPNNHQNSKLMRVQNETALKIETVAQEQRRAANAQLAVIVDEWCAMKGIHVDTSALGVPKARRTTRRRTSKTAAAAK